MPLFRCLILALALAAGAAIAGTRVLPPGAVQVDADTRMPDTARLAIVAGEVLAHVERGDADAAFAQLQAIADPLAFELVAARVIDALAAQPRPPGGPLLERLESVPVRVFRRHDETAADWFLPLVDVATRAKSARRVLAANAARDVALASLLADPAAAASLDAQALAAAIDELPETKATVLAARVASDEVALPGRALVRLALRTSDEAVWALARERGAEEDVLALFAAVDARLPETQALQWLKQSASDARYTSVAVMATGRMAPRSKAAAQALDGYLGRVDTGPSAAAALVAHAGPSLLDDIEQRLAKTRDPLRVQHLALALRLADTPAATRRLEALGNDPRLPASAKAELQR